MPEPKDRPKVPAKDVNFVQSVDWDDDADKPDNALRETLAGWIGQPITGEQLVSAFLELAHSPERRKHPIQVAILRDGDQTGIHLRVRRGPSEGDGSTIRVLQFAQSGTEVLHHSSGGGSGDSYLSPDDWRAFQKNADQALKSPPEKPFIIQVVFGPG